VKCLAWKLRRTYDCKIQYSICGIIGLRNQLPATAGEAIMAHRFIGYEPYKGEIAGRNKGSLFLWKRKSNSLFYR
jgi:predicted membrane GTPase involved in stress response